MKRIFVLFSLFTLLLLGGVACAAGGVTPGAAPAAADGAITVVGSGEAFGAPDTAELQMGAETFAESVGEATSQNEALITAIMEALAAQGIEDRDIRTSNYSLWAEQIYGERGPEGIAGYRVSNLVSVTMRDVERIGDVISAVTAAGANNIHGISFHVADPDALEDEARAAAIADARARAESLATLNGVELGDVVSISEVIGQTPWVGGGGAVRMEAADAVSVSPGELSYSVQVQVSYAIR